VTVNPHIHIVDLNTRDYGQVLTQVMYDLVSRPGYMVRLRDDITGQVNKHGWTKTSYDNMTMLDSFIKDSMRITGGGLGKPFTSLRFLHHLS
jgi:hypothetical protein